MMRKRWDCPKCGKPFATRRGAESHIKDVHGEGVCSPRKRKRPTPPPDCEPSLADIAVEAELKRLMGEPLDPLEESLIND